MNIDTVLRRVAGTSGEQLEKIIHVGNVVTGFTLLIFSGAMYALRNRAMGPLTPRPSVRGMLSIALRRACYRDGMPPRGFRPTLVLAGLKFRRRCHHHRRCHSVPGFPQGCNPLWAAMRVNVSAVAAFDWIASLPAV